MSLQRCNAKVVSSVGGFGSRPSGDAATPGTISFFEGQVFFATFDQDLILAGRQVDRERMCRNSGMAFDRVWHGNPRFGIRPRCPLIAGRSNKQPVPEHPADKLELQSVSWYRHRRSSLRKEPAIVVAQPHLVPPYATPGRWKEEELRGWLVGTFRSFFWFIVTDRSPIQNSYSCSN